MTETAETTRTPGKHEAAALRAMTEVEQPDNAHVVRSIIVCRSDDPKDPWFKPFEWSETHGAWFSPGETAFSREQAIDYLAGLAGHADVTLIDEALLLADLSPDDFDVAFFEGGSMLCPEGTPGAPEQWAGIRIGADGRGDRIGESHRFSKAALAAQFRVWTSRPGAAAAGPTMIRHHLAARDYVDQEHWDISGRPDVAARRIDEELARNAFEIQDRIRASKEHGVRGDEYTAFRARELALAGQH